MIERERRLKSQTQKSKATNSFLLSLMTKKARQKKNQDCSDSVGCKCSRVTNFLIYFFDWLFLHSCSNRSIYSQKYKLPNPKSRQVVRYIKDQRSIIHLKKTLSSTLGMDLTPQGPLGLGREVQNLYRKQITITFYLG